MQNLVEVSQALLVLDLRDDLDVLPRGAQDFANALHVGCPSDERGGDVVGMLDTEVADVALVLGGQGRELYGRAREVHVLLFAQGAGIPADHRDRVSFHFGDGACQGAVGDEDARPNGDGLWQLLVRAGDLCLVARLLLVRRDPQLLAGLDLYGLALLEHTRPDLRTLRIKHDRHSLARPLFERLLQI